MKIFNNLESKDSLLKVLNISIYLLKQKNSIWLIKNSFHSGKKTNTYIL